MDFDFVALTQSLIVCVKPHVPLFLELQHDVSIFIRKQKTALFPTYSYCPPSQGYGMNRLGFDVKQTVFGAVLHSVAVSKLCDARWHSVPSVR